ncbi:MAG: flagellar basal body L-ring protein FlgH [Planctomycetota bacterium]
MKFEIKNKILTIVLILQGVTVDSLLFPDSLLKNNENIYSQTKKRQFQKHDLITVIISEETIANVRGSTKSDRRTRWEWALNEFIRLASQGNITETKLEPTARGSKPKVNMDSRLRNDNTASTQHSTTFESKLQAEIVEILPNGNLVIEAKKAVKINDEEETVIVKGVVSQEDIGLDNSVRSEKVASVEINFNSKGTVGDNQKRGWLTKILNSLWPF